VLNATIAISRDKEREEDILGVLRLYNSMTEIAEDEAFKEMITRMNKIYEGITRFVPPTRARKGSLNKAFSFGVAYFVSSWILSVYVCITRLFSGIAFLSLGRDKRLFAKLTVSDEFKKIQFSVDWIQTLYDKMIFDRDSLKEIVGCSQVDTLNKVEQQLLHWQH
jgi:hypothetical protein